MDLTQIRYFLTLAKTLNFTRAAELCNVTQPALTKSIQRLEAELGGPLLRRERIHTQLTPLGITMLPLLQQTFDAAETARQSAQRFRKQDTATLTLGLGPLVEPLVVSPLLHEVDRRFAGLKVTIRHESASCLNDRLLSAELDVALTAEPERLTDRAHRWPLFMDPIVALLPEGDPLAASEHVGVDDLRGRVMIGRVAPQPGMPAEPDIEQRLNLGPSVQHRGSSDEHVHTLVRAAIGIALSTGRRMVPPGIARRAVIPAKPLQIVVASVAGRPLSRAADAFLRLARARDWASDLA